MDFFALKSWPGTIVLLCVFYAVLFVLACILGFFVDPAMSMSTRGAIVGSWATVAGVLTIPVLIVRHG